MDGLIQDTYLNAYIKVTHNKTAKRWYQWVQCHTGLILQILHSKVMPWKPSEQTKNMQFGCCSCTKACIFHLHLNFTICGANCALTFLLSIFSLLSSPISLSLFPPPTYPTLYLSSREGGGSEGQIQRSQWGEGVLARPILSLHLCLPSWGLIWRTTIQVTALYTITWYNISCWE